MALIDILLTTFIRCCLWLRYRIRVKGLDTIAAHHSRSILFLPNHPALIDPIILMTFLFRRFQARALADSDQIDRFFVRFLARRARILPIPSVSKKGVDSTEQVRQVIQNCVHALQSGDNLVLYPSGRLMRSRLTEIGANSAVETIVKQLPDTPVVLVRTSGLWGSRFSWASGSQPTVGRPLKHALWRLLLNAFIFMPRRTVTIHFEIASDFPRRASRKTINDWLENYYNADPDSNTYVPDFFWQFSSPRLLPEPAAADTIALDDQIPQSLRQQVTQFLATLSGQNQLTDSDRLSTDLGLDSLAIAEIITWLENEFGLWQVQADSLQTVGDVLLAACGESSSHTAIDQRPAPPTRWFNAPARLIPTPNQPALADQTITSAFLDRAAANMNRVILADSISQAKTFRDLITAIFVLKRQFRQLPGDRLGIMMPASVASAVFFLAALFSGKTPVMINWTLGGRNLLHAVKNAHVNRIITSQQLLSRLEKQNIDLGAISDRLICIESLQREITRWHKISGWLAARFRFRSLTRCPVPETAVILFTSGSESFPKAVPLTHRNIMTNIADALSAIDIHPDDSLLGILPPFHSFGITVCTVLPLTAGIPVVYYPNPTHGAALAAMIGAWKTTLLVGTPTFLNAIVRAARPHQIDSLSLVVSGAEKCPRRTFDLVQQKCPHLTILEGYGVTECSPILSANSRQHPVAGTIGTMMPSVQYIIVNPDTLQPVEPHQTGMLLVRGPSVFSGYLNTDSPSPFVQYGGQSWYQTGDLVSQDPDGILTFQGRLKRFVKIGGEMVSLPAIEATLLDQLPQLDSADDAPSLCVSYKSTEGRPEIILYTTTNLTRDQANQAIRAAGLSGLHNIRSVVKLDSIPLLGTGKVNYRALPDSTPES